jgi:hypothetical protein
METMVDEFVKSYSDYLSFHAGDRIDQGEMISLLIWRIFYDPLLTRINDDHSVGYVLGSNQF